MKARAATADLLFQIDWTGWFIWNAVKKELAVSRVQPTTTPTACQLNITVPGGKPGTARGSLNVKHPVLLQMYTRA